MRAEFADPDRFDISRMVKPNLGFGFGFHHCLGINIARCEVAALSAPCSTCCRALRVVDCDRGSSWALLGPRALEMALAS